MRHPLPPEVEVDPFAAIRESCSAVAARARSVRIDADRLERYAAGLSAEQVRAATPGVAATLSLSPAKTAGGSGPGEGPAHDPREQAAFVLVLDAVNFGSGYFPHLRKRPGLSGYRTVEASLRDWWLGAGPPSARALAGARPEWVAGILGQSTADAVAWELMGLYARAWRDLGRFAERSFDGDLTGPVTRAGGSGAALVRELCAMPFYRDIASYETKLVAFLKRAQITVNDLASTVAGPLGAFRDLDELTIFADNLVPHVLRVDGVLVFAPELVARIDRGEPLPWGGREEVEIRACAVHAAEEILGRLRGRGERLAARELDVWLWSRGQQARYKERPRHRARSVFY